MQIIANDFYRCFREFIKNHAEHDSKKHSSAEAFDKAKVRSEEEKTKNFIVKPEANTFVINDI